MAPVLVVDDDQAIRETLRFVLEDSGYEVEEAADGAAALQRLRSSARPMVVLLDCMMPRMNGDDVLAIVADDAQLRQFHAFVMVTASPRPRMLTVGRAGVGILVPCVEKPFDIDDLLDAVAHAAQHLTLAQVAPEGVVKTVAYEAAD